MAPSTFLPLLVLALAASLGAAQNATMVFTGVSTMAKPKEMLDNGMKSSGKSWKCECPKWYCQIGDKPTCDDLEMVGGMGPPYARKVVKGEECINVKVNLLDVKSPYLDATTYVETVCIFSHRIYDGKGNECDHDCDYECAHNV